MEANSKRATAIDVRLQIHLEALYGQWVVEKRLRLPENNHIITASVIVDNLHSPAIWYPDGTCDGRAYH
ncbi:hypothetical protein KCP75_09360 [Salmonella enterica subsp. enterica]|nr:hypothetical protein KCP75_09360 [Salmonella enterica subsp. enterica]